MIDELFRTIGIVTICVVIIRFHIEQSTRISALEKKVEDLEIEIKEWNAASWRVNCVI